VHLFVAVLAFGVLVERDPGVEVANSFVGAIIASFAQLTPLMSHNLDERDPCAEAVSIAASLSRRRQMTMDTDNLDAWLFLFA
jgi:hypothetical protein